MRSRLKMNTHKFVIQNKRDMITMKDKGVIFHGAPAKVPGGKGVGFEDLYGNQFDLYQPD